MLSQEVALGLDVRHQRAESLLTSKHLHPWHNVNIVIILHIINEVGVYVVLELDLGLYLAGWVLRLIVHPREVVILSLLRRPSRHHLNSTLVDLGVLNPLVDRLPFPVHLWTKSFFIFLLILVLCLVVVVLLIALVPLRYVVGQEVLGPLAELCLVLLWTGLLVLLKVLFFVVENKLSVMRLVAWPMVHLGQ